MSGDRRTQLGGRLAATASIPWAVVILILGSLGTASAAAPGEINFQGLLLQFDGAVVNASVDLDFELFDAATAGNSLWTESHANVSVLDGVYDVALGSVTPINASVLASGSVWLEVTVEGETLTPRQRLLAVPYALQASEADHAATADQALSADVAGNLPIGALDAIYSTYSFDGSPPANDDPREGTADPDGDGVLNFLDADNDNDGQDDATELSQGTDINLVTPTLSGYNPSPVSDILSTDISVTGTRFVAGLTVQINGQSPTPSNITPTSFDITVNPELASMTSMTVTRPNGEQASQAFEFGLTTPSIVATFPTFIRSSESATLNLVGSNFVGPVVITFDGVVVVPTSLTPTGFSIDIVAPVTPGDVPVVITLSNGEFASILQPVEDFRIAFLTSTLYSGSEVGGLAGADALCMARATAAGLSGTFRAWLGDSTGNPSTRFTQSTEPYRRTDAVKIADDFTDLADGLLDNPLNRDEFGVQFSSFAWANVTVGGLTVSSSSCSDWTSDSGDGRRGLTNSTTGTWMSFSDLACGFDSRLYCIQQ